MPFSLAWDRLTGQSVELIGNGDEVFLAPCALLQQTNSKKEQLLRKIKIEAEMGMSFWKKMTT